MSALHSAGSKDGLVVDSFHLYDQARALLALPVGERYRSDLVVAEQMTRSDMETTGWSPLLIGQTGVKALVKIPDGTVIAIYEGDVTPHTNSLEEKLKAERKQDPSRCDYLLVMDQIDGLAPIQVDAHPRYAQGFNPIAGFVNDFRRDPYDMKECNGNPWDYPQWVERGHDSLRNGKPVVSQRLSSSPDGKRLIIKRLNIAFMQLLVPMSASDLKLESRRQEAALVAALDLILLPGLVQMVCGYSITPSHAPCCILTGADGTVSIACTARGLVSARDIEQREWLATSYGSGYWAAEWDELSRC